MKGEDTSLENTVVEFISGKHWDDNMEKEFKALANKNGQTITLPREVSRKRVAAAFGDAFELIGGVPRLALWANANETEFYKLFAKLLPSAASGDLDESKEEKVIRHILPHTDLDK